MGNCFFAKQKQSKKPTEASILEVQDQSNMLGVSMKLEQTCVKQRKEARNKQLLQLSFKEEVFENVERIEKNKGPSDFQTILNALGQHYFFEKLSYQHKEEIVYKMFYCMVQKGQYVFEQGDRYILRASSYFIVDRGSCEIIIHDQVKKVITAGTAFGELALLYNALRSASVKAKEDSYFWGIDRKTFRKAVEDLAQQEYSENRTFIDTINFFDILNSEQKDLIAGVIVTQQFKSQDAIVIEGDMASSYFIIQSGTVTIKKDGKEIRKMSAGDTFGEQALYKNSVRYASVFAESAIVKCLSLGRDTLTNIMGDQIQVIAHNNILRWAFQKHQVLSRLTPIQIEKLVTNIQISQMKNLDLIFRKGDKCDRVVFVLEGKLEAGGKSIVLRGGMYGDQYITQESISRIIEGDIIISSEEGGGAKIASITYEQFSSLIGGQLDQILKKNENSHGIKYMQNAYKKADYDHLILNEMVMIKKLGFGQFGSVYLVKNQNDHKLYALKCILKRQIVEQGLEKHLVQEMKVLEHVQFPLIMEFIKSIKDDNNIYFLVEYIKGLELFDVIREIGLLNTSDSQFYIASLLLCIEYLHGHSIIFRDIKPENIMVDHNGYVKLIDMGTAKFLKGKASRTFTIIGTPHYMAPEIITGKGYTYTVDIWSIGICLFELMCGGVPFAEDAEDPYQIYEEIVKKTLSYPLFLKDRKAKKLMEQMLNKTPEIRLGGSYAALKANSWFEHFDWDKLMDRDIKAPYIPPREKMVSDEEVQEQEHLGKLVGDEIRINCRSEDLYKQKLAKNPDWDSEF